MRRILRKKELLVPALGAALLLLLSGCRKEMEGENLYLGVPGAEAGVFTGVLEDGQGEGTLDFPDWSYTGSFTVPKEEEPGALLTGTAEALPWTLVFAGEEIPGRYSGPLENAVPVGEGVFEGREGLSFTGQIFGQSPVEGEVTQLPLSLSFQGSRYTGIYQGHIENGYPEGETVWEAENAAGQSLHWEGAMSQGLLSGEGSLSCERLNTTVEGRERSGAYEGRAVDGVPQGEGSFRSVDAQGIPWSYEGEWKDGLMDGQGVLRYQAPDHLIRSGTFRAGSFSPDWIQALEVLGTGEPVFALNEAQREFLSEHPELWEELPRTDFYDSGYKKTLDRNLNLWKCFDDPEVFQTPGWMELYSLKVLSAFVGPAFPGGPDMTRILAAERNYERILYILVPGVVEDIAANQWVSLIGMPVGLSDYTTILGARHDCLVLVAGDLAITG